MKLELKGSFGEVAAFVLGLFLGAAIAVTISVNKYRDDLCQEQFAHAETAADTLNIIQNDKFCLEYSK
jgi:hypothetical protein